MKKITALIMCLAVLLCSACGNKEAKDAEVKNEQQVNQVEQATKDINEKISKDPATIEQSDIEKAKESASEMEKELKDQVGKVKEEDVEQFQNRQVAVEILKQGLEALEKAKAEGDQEAITKAKVQIEMAQSLWDFKQEE